MSSTTMTAAEPGSNPTTAANNNPAPPTSKPTSDAPSYTSDISPPAYSEAAPANDLAAPSASTPTTTAAAASTPAPTTTAPTANDDDDDDDGGGGEDLPATPIPFHFLINQPPPSPSPSDAAAAPQPPRKITHTHPVPDILLSTAAPPASAQDLFVAVLQDVLGAHQDECRDAAPGACDVCGEEKESVLLTPVSFLHVDEGAPPAYGGEAVAGKRVDVLVTPVCGKAECGEVARRRVRCAMEEEGVGDGEGEERVVPAAGPEDPRCRVCGRGEGTRRCAGCGVVRYCGRECQRQDWRGGHKRVCAAWAALVEEGRAEEARQRAEEGGGA